MSLQVSNDGVSRRFSSSLLAQLMLALPLDCLPVVLRDRSLQSMEPGYEFRVRRLTWKIKKVSRRSAKRIIIKSKEKEDAYQSPS